MEIIEEELKGAPAAAQPDAPAVQGDSDDELEAQTDIAAQDAARQQQVLQPWEKPGLTPEQIVDACIHAFRSSRSSKGEFTIPKDRCPLKWWRVREKTGEFGPYIPMLARRALAAPATSAPVERVFSGCAQICTRNKNRLSAKNISLALFLNKAWDTCPEMGLQGAVDEMYDGCDEEEME